MSTCEKCGDETGRCKEFGESTGECGWEVVARTRWEEMCRMFPAISRPVQWESFQGPRKPVEIKAMRLTMEKHYEMVRGIIATSGHPRKGKEDDGKETA